MSSVWPSIFIRRRGGWAAVATVMALPLAVATSLPSGERAEGSAERAARASSWQSIAVAPIMGRGRTAILDGRGGSGDDCESDVRGGLLLGRGGGLPAD